MTEFRAPMNTSPDPRRATTGWWGIGSVAAGVTAAAFLPAALFGGHNWSMDLWNSAPVWVICCCIGVATGIRGMQKQRYATRKQIMTAATGTLISLVVFVTFAMISLMAAA